MYLNGRGVAQDDSMAVFWYRKAVEQGHVNAQTSLGVMYEKGRGVSERLWCGCDVVPQGG